MNKLITFLLFITVINAGGAQIQFCVGGESSEADCEYNLCVMCDINGYTGSTAGFGADPDGDLPFLGFCGTIQNVQFLVFYAAVSAMTITVTASNCSMNSGIDLAIMRYCDLPVLNCVQGNGSNSSSLVLNGLQVGAPYVLIIDVDAAGVCDIEISVDPPNGTSGASIPVDVSGIAGDFTVCPYALTAYSPIPAHNGNHYEWTVPPGATITNDASNGELIKVYWWDTNGGPVCVTETNPCTGETKTVCHDVVVTPIPNTVLPPVKVCPEALPYELPWGEMVNNSGTYSTNQLSYYGCDSILIQTVTVLSPILKHEPPVELCEDGCLIKCGQTFCGYGDYTITCQSYLGCDSVINFSIIPPNIVAQIQGENSLSCSRHQIILSSALSSGIKTWYNSEGQQVGTGSVLTVTAPGTYVLIVKQTLGGQDCFRMDSVYIPLDTLPPGIQAVGARVGCDTLPVFLHASATDSIAHFDWTGPNGYTANGPNPEVSEIGTYIVQATALSNGCIGSDTVEVTDCCLTNAGIFDSTQMTICGNGGLLADFLGNEHLEPGDSLTFFLYTNPANPLGSILMYSDSAFFPFLSGILQFDTVYYVATLAGMVATDHSIRTDTSCWSLSNGQPVRWVQKPVISLASAPTAVCKGDCMNMAFDFTGTPPFQFHLGIMQNGNLLYSKDLISNGLHQIFSICPADFIQPLGSGPLNFTVGYFQDKYCSCGN